MYYVTDLVKFKKYKILLTEILPKPNISISDVKPDNKENPSLTGNSFETLFAVCQLDRDKFEKAFELEFKRADSNLAKLTPDLRNGNIVVNGKLFFGVKNKEYHRILSTIKKVVKMKEINTVEQISPFCYLEISTELYSHPSLLADVAIRTGLSPINPYNDIKRIIVFDSDSCVAYLKDVPRYFKKEIINFYETGKCTKSFVKSILYFTQISHQFASHFLFDILFHSDSYLKQTARHFRYFCKAHSPLKGNLTRKPILDLLEICARPDFRINNKLYEIKACKKFAMVEYLQALTYLIFAQHPENRKLHGKIKSIILYYVLTNQQIEIKSNSLILDEVRWKNLASSIRSFKANRRIGMV